MNTPKEQTELQVFKTVLLHCIVIIAFPVVAFFASKVLIFDALFGLSAIASNVYSAGVAVVILHIGLAAFIYRAYFDSPIKTTTKSD